MAKKVNLGESVTIVELRTGSTRAGQAKKNPRARKQKESVENETKKSKASLSLIESVSRLDCGSWEKETTCGIQSRGPVTVMSCTRDLADRPGPSKFVTSYIDLEFSTTNLQ